MNSVHGHATPLGQIRIGDNGTAVTYVEFRTGGIPFPEGMEERETPLQREALHQILEYLKGERRRFDLPLAPAGTPFQRAAWDALLAIPYGETRSYKQQAEAVGSPKAFRAVGLANNKNPIAVIIPCHRVIGANGSLVGYGGGLAIKKKLLELEYSVSRQGSLL